MFKNPGSGNYPGAGLGCPPFVPSMEPEKWFYVAQRVKDGYVARTHPRSDVLSPGVVCITRSFNAVELLGSRPEAGSQWSWRSWIAKDPVSLSQLLRT